MSMMKGLTYQKPGVISWKSIPMPTIQNEKDVIGKVLATTICGSDLHVLKGEFPETTELASNNNGDGIVLGHEAVIKVEEVGSEVTKVKKGDVCIVSCITFCGECYYCANNMQSHCKGTGFGTGWALGHLINGTQAEYIRIPHGDASLYPAPQNVPLEKLVMLSDALPTGYEIGILNGEVKKGESIAIVGLGPVGLSTLLTATTLELKQIICIDLDEERLNLAMSLGATHKINSKGKSVETVKQEVESLTTNLVKDKEPGVDVAIECVGAAPAFELCQELITPGGRIANVGVHGKKVDLQLQDLWIKNIKLTTGLVSTYSVKELIGKVENGELDPTPIISHHFKFDEFEKAYEIFKDAANSKAIKVVLTP